MHNEFFRRKRGCSPRGTAPSLNMKRMKLLCLLHRGLLAIHYVDASLQALDGGNVLAHELAVDRVDVHGLASGNELLNGILAANLDADGDRSRLLAASIALTLMVYSPSARSLRVVEVPSTFFRNSSLT